MPSCQFFLLGQKNLAVILKPAIALWILDWNLKVDLSIHLSNDKLRMLSFSRIFLYRHRKSVTHHLYSMLFHVGYFLVIWWLKAFPNHLTTENWRWMDGRGTVWILALAAALLCVTEGITEPRGECDKWLLMCNELTDITVK